jgi:NADPH:quinone reductase
MIAGMRALVLGAVGELPEIGEVAAPRPGKEEVLVRISAAGVNYADTMMRRGFYLQAPVFPFIPGFEFSGVVIEVGQGAKRWRPGDRVMGTGQSAFAEYAVAPEAALMPVPSAFTDEQAAAFPVIYLTAFAMLKISANAQAGETILVHAAAGGVGTAAIQLAKHLGLRVIAAASSEEKLATARRLGADVAINYSVADFVPPVLEATEGRGADIILESIGGDFLERDIRAAAPFGRVVVFGMASGTQQPADVGSMFRNSVSVAAFWMVTLGQRPERLAQLVGELLAIVEQAKITPVIGGVYPLEKGAEALLALESRRTIGKLLLKP